MSVLTALDPKMSTQPMWYLLILIPPLCHGFGSGVPDNNNTNVCTTLIPAHRNSTTQNSPAPFGIIISPATYTPGGSPINVTLLKRCDSPFRGFLLMARYASASANGNLRPGNFTTPEWSKKTCSAGSVFTQAVTHNSSSVKPDTLTFQWTPPLRTDQGGHIVFRATFLESKLVYWVDVHSDVLVDSTLGKPSESDFVTTGSTAVAPGGCPKGAGGSDRRQAMWLVVWVLSAVAVRLIYKA